MRLRIGRVDEDSASRLTHPGEVGPAESVKAGASSDRHAHHYDRHAPPPPGSRRRPTPPGRGRQRRDLPSPSPARHTVRARRRAQPAPAPPARTRRCRHPNRHAEPRLGRTRAHRDSRRQPPATPPTRRPSLAADGARRDLSLTVRTYSPPLAGAGASPPPRRALSLALFGTLSAWCRSRRPRPHTLAPARRTSRASGCFRAWPTRVDAVPARLAKVGQPRS